MAQQAGCRRHQPRLQGIASRTAAMMAQPGQMRAGYASPSGWGSCRRVGFTVRRSLVPRGPLDVHEGWPALFGLAVIAPVQVVQQHLELGSGFPACAGCLAWCHAQRAESWYPPTIRRASTCFPDADRPRE